MPVVNFFPQEPNQAKYAELTLVVCDECWSLQLGQPLILPIYTSNIIIDLEHQAGTSNISKLSATLWRKSRTKDTLPIY